MTTPTGAPTTATGGTATTATATGGTVSGGTATATATGGTATGAAVSEAAVPGAADTAARLLALGTGTVSDALDRLGIPGQCAGIAALVPGGTLAGPAFTVRYGPNGRSGGTVGDYIDDVPPGHVVVLDNRGRTDATVWGDILTTVASARGIGGTVIDGVCRDLDRSLDAGYPIFARGNWMRTGKDRVRAEEIGGPVGIGGARVCAGDVLIGDRDGVLALPAARLDEIHHVAAEIVAREDEIRARVAKGGTLREARARTGYHHLQTPHAAQERDL